MSTLRGWLKDATIDEEDIMAVVLGESGWGSSHGIEAFVGKYVPGKIYTFEEIAPVFDIEFDGGYGSPHCPTVAVYTNKWIFSVYQYDGSTNWFCIRRDPVEGYIPEMPGG